jgi:outer membrane receptor protein involved in Fe transport
MMSVRHAVAGALRAAEVERDARLNGNRTSRYSPTGAALCALAVTIGLSSAAYAQQADQPAAGGAQSLEEITVTGSRIKRTTDFDTANPTTVLDANYLQNLGIVNVGQAITQLPSNISNNTPTTTGNANFFTGSTIANLRGLNPFFGSRTLTLVNTRRFVPTNQGDGVDLNFIPSILIDRVDSVTGGASAAYGSGAIAGVQNIFLNTKLEGGRVDADYQQSMHSDAKDKHVGFAYGQGFAGDRGHFVIGGEYEDMDAVGCITARDFCAKNRGFFQNTSVPGTYLAGENLRANQQSFTGVLNGVPSGPGTVFQANAAGNGVQNFALGLEPYASAGSPFNVVPGGDGVPIYQRTNLRAPVERKLATAVLRFALNDTGTLNLTADASYGNVETLNQTAALGSNFVGVNPGNPFAAPVLAAAGGLGFALVNKSWDQQADSFTRFTTRVRRASIGLDGRFGDSSWSWDTYYQIGRTDREQLVHDNLHNNATSIALNVISDPVTGQPVCAAKANPAAFPLIDPNLAAACVPVNIFGTQPLTQAQHDFIFGDLDERLDYTQQVWALNASGSLSAGWGAGEIMGAVGLEHRRELGHNLQPDQPQYIRTDYLIQYGEPFSGDVKVNEAYVEVNMPLLKDLPAVRRLGLDLAARESRYENHGLAGTTGLKRNHNLTTWKASATWDIIDPVRLRATQSRDARAGNFRELYYGQIIGAGGLFGYCGPAGSFQQDPCTWSLEGNPDVRPERSDTTTFGVVWSPSGALDGLQASVDFFRIKIKDAIQQANVRNVIDGCQQRNEAENCALITPDIPGDFQYHPDPSGAPQTGTGITFVRALAFNGAQYSFRGLDISAIYRMNIGSGNLTWRLLAENMMRQEFQNNPNLPPSQLVGQTGTSNSFLSDNQPQPKWTGSLTGSYNRGPLTVTGQMRFVGHGIMDYNNPDGSSPTTGLAILPRAEVPSYQVFSLSGMYAFENIGPLGQFQVYGVIDNVFDKQPPFASGITAFGLANNFGGTNATFFDTLGRMYRIGVRMNF